MKRLSNFTAWIVLVLFVVSACAVAPKHPIAGFDLYELGISRKNR